MAKSKKGVASRKSGGGGVVKALAAAAAPQAAEVSRKPQSPETAKRAEPARKPTAEQISARAHQIWIDAGKPQGSALDHWLRAERELSK